MQDRIKRVLVAFGALVVITLISVLVFGGLEVTVIAVIVLAIGGAIYVYRGGDVSELLGGSEDTVPNARDLKDQDMREFDE